MAEVKAPCWAEVSIDAIVNNFRQVRQYVRRDCRCLAIVKADAYGHGAVTVARALEAAGADRFGVATLAEARELRDAGITLPILILSYTPPAAAAELAQLNVMQSVTDAAYAEALNAEAAKAGVTLTVHVKVDTGMSRVGFVYHDEADDATVDDIARAAMLPQLQAEGLFTHFAMADAESEQATRRQFALFEGLTAALARAGHYLCGAALLQQRRHVAVPRNAVGYGAVRYRAVRLVAGCIDGIAVPVDSRDAVALRGVASQAGGGGYTYQLRAHRCDGTRERVGNIADRVCRRVTAGVFQPRGNERRRAQRTDSGARVHGSMYVGCDGFVGADGRYRDGVR